MTTQATENNSKKNTAQPDSSKDRAEAAGFDTSDWNSANLEIGGWMDPKTSKRVVGRAVEAIQIEGEFGLQDVVKVRLALPCEALKGSGDAIETVLLKKDDIIAVRVSANLQTLLRCVRNECAVEIIPQGERKLKKGRKMWAYGFKYKGELASPVMGTPAPVSGGGDRNDDDNLPF